MRSRGTRVRGGHLLVAGGASSLPCLYTGAFLVAHLLGDDVLGSAGQFYASGRQCGPSHRRRSGVGDQTGNTVPQCC